MPTQFYQLGNQSFARGDYAAAEHWYRQAIAVKPEFADAVHNLGVAVAEQGRTDEAIECYRRTLRQAPEYVAAYYNLGNALRVQLKHVEAIANYLEALQRQPRWPEASMNLGLSYLWDGQLDVAEKCFKQTLQWNSQHASAINGLALIAQRRGGDEQAMELFNQAIALEPEHVSAHVNRSQLLLKKGDFEEGWREYEWRWRMPQNQFSSSIPRWNGESLRGKTILIWKEQGIGDAIQFLRYTKLLKRDGATVVAAAPQTLHAFFATCPWLDQLVELSDPDVTADYQTAILDLPWRYGTRLGSIPAPIPYLNSDPQRVEAWRQRLPLGFRVGIAWRGSPGYPEDCHRSISPEQFAPLAEIPGVRLVSLQRQPEPARLSVKAASPELDADGAFLDTAAIMKSLDVVVTADTSIGHVAGAIGVPCWIALSKASDWRWLTARDDSPWYPTVRLYRQEQLDDWGPVFERISKDIRQAMKAF